MCPSTFRQLAAKARSQETPVVPVVIAPLADAPVHQPDEILSHRVRQQLEEEKSELLHSFQETMGQVQKRDDRISVLENILAERESQLTDLKNQFQMKSDHNRTLQDRINRLSEDLRNAEDRWAGVTAERNELVRLLEDARMWLHKATRIIEDITACDVGPDGKLPVTQEFLEELNEFNKNVPEEYCPDPLDDPSI